MSLSPLEEIKKRAQHSVLLRISSIGILIVLLQIPIDQIERAINERQQTREAAVQEVTSTWGDQQTLAGPLVVVPYLERWRDEKSQEHVATRYAFFQPEKLVVKGEVETQRRRRGIFEIPLYLTTLKVSGELIQPDFSSWTINPHDVLWDGATVVVGISDPKAIREQMSLHWDGKDFPFEPGRDNADFFAAGVNVAMPSLKGAKPGSIHRFDFELRLGGSGYLHFLPFGLDTRVELASQWPDPSFDGAYLPDAREVSKQGFTAKWHVLHLGRNYPQKWLKDEVKEPMLSASSFGVSFLSPVDAYAATTRSVKYEILFVTLTFLIFYLFELFHKLRLHPVQYLLVGFSLCLFYLLLLALSEHIGFAKAYPVASLAVVLVNFGYCLSILKDRFRAFLVGGELVLLYGFLFLLLQVQDYALLVGSLGLFLVLAAVMYATRKVDWYRVSIDEHATAGSN